MMKLALATSAVWIASFLSHALLTQAQIKVLAPRTLAKQFSANKGKIDGSTATFGAPFYGDRVLGRLVWGESKHDHAHCEEDDYEVPSPEVAERPGYRGNNEVRLINIIMVRRGKCSFTTKVRVAFSKGAHAVIIVDKEDSNLTAKDLRRIIVADDGFGEGIHIPSILISRMDGAPLIEAARSATAPVVVELAWDVPTNHVVRMDLWMSSASKLSHKFIKDFTQNRKVLNEVVRFQPHYAVFTVPKGDPQVYTEICSDTTGRYCAEDPDGSGLVTGREVLDEDVRQLCIHELTKVKQHARAQTPDSVAPVEYAEKFWNYVEKFLDTCALDAPNLQDRFGRHCSEKVMQSVGLDVAAVEDCFMKTRDEKLAQELENTAWSPRALRINGWRYNGILEADLVTRAVCAGFIKQPKECADLLTPRDPFQRIPAPTVLHNDGVSLGTLLGVLAGAALVGACAMMLYRRHLKKSFYNTIREGVVLEVQSQMDQYARMSDRPTM